MKIDVRELVTCLIACTCCTALVCALAGCSSGSSGDDADDTADEAATESAEETDSTQNQTSIELQGVEAGSEGYIDTAAQEWADGDWVATVTVEGFDSFDIELDGDDAPVTVSNFCSLASNGYYDGLAFYRVVEDFCLQGGTMGNSASGADADLCEILGEFSDNGVDNELADSFEEGVVAMARTSEANSATSTFFITLGSGSSIEASLNGQYAAFGTIDETGMEVVDEIVESCAQYADDSMGAIADEENMPIIESIVISEA